MGAAKHRRRPAYCVVCVIRQRNQHQSIKTQAVTKDNATTHALRSAILPHKALRVLALNVLAHGGLVCNPEMSNT